MRRPLAARHPLARLALVSVGLAPQLARAADTLPVGGLEPGHVATVTKADGAQDGDLRAAVVVRAAEGAARARELDPGFAAGERASDELLRDANAVSLLFGFGVARGLELAVGIHGTFEHVRADQRDALFPVQDPTLESDWRQSFRQTGFSGASLMLKLAAYQARGFRVAVAPFVESGAGERATYSLTRSVGPKGGLVAAASYGARGVADLSLNLGWRYRDPETVGVKTLRHEVFSKALAEASLSRDLALFVAGETRRLMVSDGPVEVTDDAAEARRAYAPRWSGQVSGGLSAQAGDARLTLHAGGRVGPADGFGYGRRSYGAAIAWDLGNTRGFRAPRETYAKEIEAERARTEPREIVGPRSFQEEVEAVFPPQGTYEEMAGEEIDPLAHAKFSGDDDFTRAEKRLETHKLKDGEVSADEKVRRELEEIKEADAKAAAAREKEERAEEARRRKEAAKRAAEQEKLMREWMQEAEKEAAAIDGITSDEEAWSGLEE